MGDQLDRSVRKWTLRGGGGIKIFITKSWKCSCLIWLCCMHRFGSFMCQLWWRTLEYLAHLGMNEQRQENWLGEEGVGRWDWREIGVLEYEWTSQIQAWLLSWYILFKCFLFICSKEHFSVCFDNIIFFHVNLNLSWNELECCENVNFLKITNYVCA